MEGVVPRIPHFYGWHMQRRQIGCMMAVALGLSLLSLWQDTSTAAQSRVTGTTQHAIGTVVVMRPDGIEERVQGNTPLQLFEWDVMRTETASQALLEIKHGIQVALNENTTLRFLSRWEKAKDITPILRLQEGEIWVKTGRGPQALEVETPVATAAVQGTEFNIKVQADGQTILTVIEGIVEFGTALNSWPIRPSTVSYAAQDKRCTKPEPTDVKPVIAWTGAILK
jgi:hypothetical protein